MNGHCPACGDPAVYVRRLDRHVHCDGSDNRRCWVAVTRGDASVVCDGCHASLAQIAARGHAGGCDRNDRHMHHASLLVEDCQFRREHPTDGDEPEGLVAA